MELIDQRTKAIMEGCKARARDAGLRFSDETLEYVVSNRDLLELAPKAMIPTLYDYWVQDVEVLREKGKYELYPHNPYETVINTRPPISFYNDNNPDWLNVMIFYHVIAHVDFFQNNAFFRHTRDFDLAGRALADKRLIARLRSEHGRWVDYVIEFARGADNLVGFFDELARIDRGALPGFSDRIDYYFDVFLQTDGKGRTLEYMKEVERYNACLRESAELGEQAFFADCVARHPELEALYLRHREDDGKRRMDVLEFLMERSPFLQRDENLWMRTLLEIVRFTSVYFQPQIRTKIMNEGWASHWHERLFLADGRIRGHEADFARVHASVTAMPRVGVNPYALGMRLFDWIEESGDRGRMTREYRELRDARRRERFDLGTGKGTETIFAVREDQCDYTFLTRFVDQDFVDRHRLFVAGERVDRLRQTRQYYVKSRKAADYRAMLVEGLYRPPRVDVREDGGTLVLNHRFEGKPLVLEYVGHVLLGLSWLWGGPVRLETSVVARVAPPEAEGEAMRVDWERVAFTMEDRVLRRAAIAS